MTRRKLLPRSFSLDDPNLAINRRLPWWTWIAPFVIFHAATQLSLNFRTPSGLAIVYLPVAIGIALVHVWGPRVIPAFFINASLSCPLWGVNIWKYCPIYASPEALEAFLSWFLFIKVARGKPWLPNLTEMAKFAFWGLLVPVTVGGPLLKMQMSYLDGRAVREHFWISVQGWSQDLQTCLTFTIPLLVFYRLLEERNLTLYTGAPPLRTLFRHDGKAPLLSIGVSLTLIALVSFAAGSSQPWFLYGVFPLVGGVAMGIVGVVLVNSWLILFALVLPLYLYGESRSPTTLFFEKGIAPILGQIELAITLFSSLLVGRALSDGKEENRWREQAEKDLQEQARSLLVEKRKAEEANLSKTQFLGNVSHELRTPLNGIVGASELLAKTPLAKEQRDFVNIVRASAENLETTVGRILDIATMETQGIELQAAAFSVPAMLERLIPRVREQAAGKGLELHCVVSLDSTPFWGDESRIERVLQELLDNAIRFTERGQVTLEVGWSEIPSRQRHLRVEVSDTGLGIDSQERERIFERFYQVNGSLRRTHGGTGLGLALVKESLDRMAAHIVVASEPGKGSSFAFEIPEALGSA